MKIHGPFEVELKVHITNGEDIQGVATIGLGKGTYPTEGAIRAAVERFERNDLPEGFRLMNKREFWDAICPERYEKDEHGERHRIRFAMPGGEEFDD